MNWKQRILSSRNLKNHNQKETKSPIGDLVSLS